VTEDMDPKATDDAALSNKQHVIGIKTAHYAAPNWIAVDRAVEAGKIAGMKDMLNVMSKFLNMGMSLDDVITKSSWNPAPQIKREELGHLPAGAIADIAVLRVAKGDFGFVDVYGARMKGSQKLVAELTLRDGKVVWDLNGITREDGDKLGDYSPPGMGAGTGRCREG